LKNVGPENIQGEANPRQERKTKQAHPTVDQDENWQYYSVQRQEETLEENQAEAVDLLRRFLMCATMHASKQGALPLLRDMSCVSF